LTPRQPADFAPLAGGADHNQPFRMRNRTCIQHRKFQETNMQLRTILASAITAVALITASGCAVQRGQETVGAYVDDSAITTSVKARYVENKEVDASAIKVETLNGTVMLSGFAKNSTEKMTAEDIAMKVKGVRGVKNAIAVRP
jgi:hyperosmotically inducible protein